MHLRIFTRFVSACRLHPIPSVVGRLSALFARRLRILLPLLVCLAAACPALSQCFSPQTPFAVGAGPSSVVVGDVNGDTRPDIITANNGSNNVSVLLGNGTGGFGAQTTFDVGAYPYSVVVGDVNGDTKPDIITANVNSNNVSVLLGNGTGGFGAQTTFDVGTYPYSVVVGDVNGDTKPDIITANNGSNNVSVLLGNGTGGFGAQTTFDVGTYPYSVVVGDVNGDTKPDIITTNIGSSNVSVLLGNGTGEVGAQTTFDVGSGPASVVVGDVNGDTKPDIITANQYSNNVSVLLNCFVSSLTLATQASPNPVCAGSTVALSVTATGSIAPYSYSWAAPAGITLSATSTSAVSASVGADVSGLQTFTVTVTPSGGAPSSTSLVSVTVNTTPTNPSLVSNGTLTCANTSVPLAASATGGVSYSLTGGSGSQSNTTGEFVVSTGGNYTVTIANASGCTATATATVASNTTPPPASLTSSGTLTCANTSVTLTANAGAGLSYRFSAGATQIGSSNQALVSTSGTYSVTITGANGCTSTTSVSVSQDNTAPVASLASSGTLTCANTSVTLTANAGTGLSYRFSAGATQIGSSNQAVVSTSGTYSVTVTASNGCTSTTSVAVSQNTTPPPASLASSGTLTCANTSVTLTANAGTGLSYRFSAGATQIGSSNQAVVSTSGTYSVTVINSGNSCTGVASVSVGQNNIVPSASLTNNGPLSCTINTVTLTAGGGNAYRFSSGASQIGATNQATVSSSGTYSVTVTAANGCEGVAQTTVTGDQSVPSVGITATPSLTISQGQSATLTAQGAASYSWSTGETTPSIQVSTAGPYSVTGTSANGCLGVASVTLTVQPTTSGPFAITGVTTLACTPVLPNRFSISFNPRYQGLNGQPVSFSITNELLPTTQPGPYTLQVYTDNPVLTLEANQSGVATRFAYNWLEACNASTTPNTPPRVAMGIPSQTATVGQPMNYVIPAGTFTDDQTPNSLQLSVRGLPPGLSFAGATLSGTPSSTVGSPFSITITATDPGGLTASTTLLLTVQPAGGTPPPPTGAFSITGVSTISCTPVAGRISIVYQPRYGGANGQPIAFDVVNESIPTTEPGPYSLTLYRDNPVITLRATQTGSDGPVTFSYNWLAACAGAGQDNTPPRLNSPVGAQTAVVGQGYSLNLSNTFIDQETPDQISLSTTGLPVGLSLNGKQISGTPSQTGVSAVSVTATDGGGLSSSTSFTITVVPASSQPPTTGTFSITGVTTMSCEVVSVGERRLTFSPRYSGLDGSPVSFSVVNELVTTTSPGPYVLKLHTDNPVIRLSAVQSGVSSTFAYNWLAACQPGARPAAQAEVPLSVVVLGNPVAGETVEVEVRGAQGQSVQLRIVDLKGQLVSERQVEQAGLVERQVLELRGHAGSHLLLQVSSGEQIHTLKLIRR